MLHPEGTPPEPEGYHPAKDVHQAIRPRDHNLKIALKARLAAEYHATNPDIDMNMVVSAPDTSYARAVFLLVLNIGPARLITTPPPAGAAAVHNTAPPVPSRKSTYPAVAEEL